MAQIACQTCMKQKRHRGLREGQTLLSYPGTGEWTSWADLSETKGSLAAAFLTSEQTMAELSLRRKEGKMSHFLSWLST